MVRLREVVIGLELGGIGVVMWAWGGDDSVLSELEAFACKP